MGVGAREVGISISENTDLLGFSHTTFIIIIHPTQ